MTKEEIEIGDEVITYDNHCGKIIKKYYATCYGILVQIKEPSGLIYHCPISDIERILRK